MEILLITRNQYDDLIGAAILKKLFVTYRRSWSLAGVTFHNVTDEDVRNVYETLNGIS